MNLLFPIYGWSGLACEDGEHRCCEAIGCSCHCHVSEGPALQRMADEVEHKISRICAFVNEVMG
jgi:hypothetical protein